MRIKKFSIAVLVLIGLSNLQAQTAVPATGGQANGSDGSASYIFGNKN